MSSGRPVQIGGDNHIRQESYMRGSYKLIRFQASIYNNNEFVCANYTCPYGCEPGVSFLYMVHFD